MLEAIYPSVTPRDYFAGLAFQALLAKAGESPDLQALAQESVVCADALVEALEQPARAH